MRAALMVFVIVSAPLSGCMSGEGGSLSEEDLDVGPDELVSGHFQSVSLESGHDMSVYVPYLVRDPITGFIQNSTVIDIERGGSFSLDLLSPPRVSMLFMLVGEHGRTNWPVREENQSWGSWLENGGDSGDWGSAVARVYGNGSLDTLNSSKDRGGPVFVKTVQTVRDSTTSVDDGGFHSSGIVHGREVYERLYRITDPTNSLAPFAGKEGYWARWAGQGNAAYEDAAQYLIAEFSSFGLEVMSHRYEYTDMLGAQNPEAYNVCAYKWGSLYIDEWLVFGAHFDVAPPANLAVLDPHITGIRTYGTRVGAYDNSAGTSMVLETARALSEFESRRTMVFCLWSGEEGGKRGSDYWTDYYVKEDNPDVTVTSYINLDMAGVNWPGGGGAPHGDPDPQIDEDGYPKDSEVWPLRVYIGPGPNHDRLDQPGMVGLSNWIGSDALGLEEQMGTLVGANYPEETWKTDVWLDMDRPEVIVYEDTTARSDHASFQDNLGTVTVGFGGLVDGYWCYHQTCDTLEEMEQWMDTTGKDYGEENSGVANVVNSLDMITWWALLTFFHCDEDPVVNGLI